MTKVNNFHQLSVADRNKIEVLLQAGTRKADIAILLDRHISTIYREISRNTAARGKGARRYEGSNAHRKTMLRHKEKPKRIRFTKELKEGIKTLMEGEKLSPELICGYKKRRGEDCVSHETIYKWLWECKHSNKRENATYKNLHKHLKHFGRRQKRKNKKDNRGCIQHRVSIEMRPKVIEKRTRVGDKEMDLVLGKDRKPGLLILQDRKTRMVWIDKIESKSATYINSKIKKILKRCKVPAKSITTDNDLAFAYHYKLETKVYFTHPYSSFEKGSIENRIGVLRRFFPKKTDFTKVSNREVRGVEKKLNNRPMKMFNFESPKDQYLKFALIT